MNHRPFKSLIFVGLLMAGCGAQDDSPDTRNDGSWAAPVELQRVPPLEGVGNGQRLERPTVAVDDQGNGLAVWEEVAVARGFAFPQALSFSSYTRTRGWSAAARYFTTGSASGSTSNLEPRLVAVGGGAFVAAWQSEAHVLVARFDSVAAWGPTQDLGPGGGPGLAVNASGAVVAAWHGSSDGTTETSGMIVSRLESGGFSAPFRVDRPQPTYNRPGDPSVVLDATGTATVVFLRSQDLVAVRVRAGQVEPDGEVVLVDRSRANLVDEAPAAGVDAAGNAFAVWRQQDDATSRSQSLWSSRFTSSQGWAAPVPVDDGAASVSAFSLAVSPGGDAFAAWSLDPAGDARVSRFTAGSWTPSVSLLQDAMGRSVSAAAGPPSLGVDGSGKVRALFASASSLFENRFASSSGWRGVETLQGAGRPGLALSANGEAIVVLAPTDSRSVSASRFVRSGS